MGIVDYIGLLSIFPALVLHEAAHAWAADLLGDTLPREQGRVTLNPAKHLSLLLTGALPLATALLSWGHFVLIGARPVEFRPHKCRHWRLGVGLVGAAGPASNLLVGIVAAWLWGVLPVGVAATVAFWVAFVNLTLGVWNLVPVPPLDGSRVLASVLPMWVNMWLFRDELVTLGVAIAIALGVWIGFGVNPLDALFSGIVSPLLRAFG